MNVKRIREVEGGRPTRYFIEYEKPGTVEPGYDTGVIEDASGLPGAHALARRRMLEHDTHVGVYERVNIRQFDDGSWEFDVEWRADFD